MKARAREAAAEVILEAAEEVAAARGLAATSTAAIAERAGVAVGTLYNYFPDRQALIDALFAWRREQMLPQLDAAADAARGLPADKGLTAYVHAVLAAFESYRLYIRVAIAADQEGVVIKTRKTSPVLARFIETVATILKPLAGNRSDMYARMLYGALKQLVHYRVERDEPIAPDGELLVQTFLAGIRR